MKTISVCTACAVAMLTASPAVAQTASSAPQAQTSPAMKLIITREAAQAAVAGHFARLDTDRDGFVTQVEADVADQEMKQRRQAGNAGKPGSGGGMTGFASYMLARADTDKDGRMSLAEAQAMGLRYFDRADADRDGRITGEERRQFHQQMTDERRPG